MLRDHSLWFGTIGVRLLCNDVEWVGVGESGVYGGGNGSVVPIVFVPVE